MKALKIKYNSDFPLIHLRPFLFAAIGFVLGILSVFQYEIYGKFLLFILSVVLVLLLFSISAYQLFRKKSKILLFCTTIAFFFGLCGGCISLMHVSAYERAEISNGYYTVYGTVKKESELEDGYSLLLSNLEFKTHDETVYSKYQMNLIVFDKREEVRNGVRIKAYVRVSKQEKGDYFAYQMANSIKYVAFAGDSEVAIVGKTNNFFDKIRLKGISLLESYFTDDVFSLSTGMLFGETEGMQEETLTQFRKLGIAHIFAVSGLHIGFLCLIITKLLRRTEARNPIRFILPTLAVFLYAGVCGFTPSALRAAIMCATALFFTCIGAPHDALSGVLLSVIVVLTINPADVMSYGFILSYACVLSILILSPIFKRILRCLPTKIGDSLAISLGIQVGVFPIQILLFGYAAPLSVLLNLIFIPLITPIYILLLVSVLCVAILPQIGVLFVFLQEILKVLLLIVGKIPSNFTIDGLDMRRGVFVYYLGVFISSYHVNLKGWVKIVLVLSCFLTFLIILI